MDAHGPTARRNESVSLVAGQQTDLATPKEPRNRFTWLVRSEPFS